MKTISITNDIIPIAVVYKKSFLDSVGRGIADADAGRTYSTEEIKTALTARRSKGQPWILRIDEIGT